MAVDGGAGGFTALISDEDDAYEFVDLTKFEKRFLKTDDVRRAESLEPVDSLRRGQRNDLYERALVRLLARQQTAARRIVIFLGRNWVHGLHWLVWELIRCPGVVVVPIEETGSSKTCSLHLAPLRDVYAIKPVYVCSAALAKLKERDDDDDDNAADDDADTGKSTAKKKKKLPLVVSNYECSQQLRGANFTVAVGRRWRRCGARAGPWSSA